MGELRVRRGGGGGQGRDGGEDRVENSRYKGNWKWVCNLDHQISVPHPATWYLELPIFIPLCSPRAYLEASCTSAPLQLAFPKGLSAAAGRPRVPPSSPVVFDVQLLYIPGLEVDEDEE